ncbi:MAG TPA: enoyl-CoA hydratase/isomerase family protein [Caulobacteraceae bacterium]|jgi:enoyl-CoA hydratase/carnithine racemase|nr:enoyl-CoA hydratase/isomerase family protein [Caulobacteraceae bacterium]
MTDGNASKNQVKIERVTPAFWRASLDNPPLNLTTPEMIRELAALIDAIEADRALKVIVFDSALPDCFMAHYDVLGSIDESLGMPPGPTGMHPFPDFLIRLSRAPVASICSIRGRATGSGSELALACDMRFASREKAILSHWEVGVGFAPGGGPMARLSRLIGRGRALEVVLGADDIDGPTAELYGYVNRSLPDSDLDGFVDTLARRIASFDRHAISLTKSFVDGPSLPSIAELKTSWEAFTSSVALPEPQRRLATLVPLGLQQPGDLEARLGYYLGSSFT